MVLRTGSPPIHGGRTREIRGRMELEQPQKGHRQPQRGYRRSLTARWGHRGRAEVPLVPASGEVAVTPLR